MGAKYQWTVSITNFVATLNLYIFKGIEFGPYSNTILAIFLSGCLL